MSNKTDILALLPDNTVGDISAKDVRDSFDIVDPEQQAPRQEYTLEGNAPKMKMDITDPTGVGAEMEVKFGTTVVASMQWNKIQQVFTFNLFDKTTGANKASFEIKPDGHAYVSNKKIPDVDEVETIIREFRTTVTHNIANHAKPTAAECVDTFKLLPHYDWTKDDDYYIKDSSGGKIVLIKYRSTPAATEANPGNFFYEVLTLAA